MSRYIVSPHAQGTDEWKKDRLGKATGSAIAAIFATVKSGEAAARADYRMDLVLERITGNVQGIDFTTKDMEWGTAQEPYSRMAYEMATDLMVKESGFVYLPNVAAGCSVDGFIHDNGRFGIWESKSPKSKTHLSYLMGNKLPSLYVPQVGIINPSEFSPANSIELIVWVAMGGRGTLVGAALGAGVVNFAKSWFTGAFPQGWLFALGALFIVVTLFLPKGILGTFLAWWRSRNDKPAQVEPPAGAPQPAE